MTGTQDAPPRLRDLRVVVSDGRILDEATTAPAAEPRHSTTAPVDGDGAPGPSTSRRPAAPVARAGAVALTGLEGQLVHAEAATASGLPQIRIVGLPDAAVREASDRVRLGCQRSGFSLPECKVVVNLAPGGIRKAGPGFDLPVALAVLGAAGHLRPDDLVGVVAVGEVGLDGRLRATAGTLPAAAVARDHGAGLFLVPVEAAPEAALVDGLEVVPVATVREAVAVLSGATERPARPRPPEPVQRHVEDLADVRGQALARRGIEIAAAGGHHVLMMGPPGCGKSMLARRLPGVLPGLTTAEALEVAAVRSIVGAVATDLDLRPPFRSPHHATSTAGLIGGGSGVARPGELSRAHRGVLFLDEVLETPRSTLDALREPLERGEVVLVRSQSRVTYPARVQLVAAANPCPCGHAGASRRPCRCRPDQVARYRGRLSGPLLDRIDLHLELEPVSEDVLVGPSDGEASADVAARVRRARDTAATRWAAADVPADRRLNRDVDAARLRHTVSATAQRRLARAVQTLGWSARTFDRCLRVARTIADLAAADVAGPDHVDEAIAYRLDTGPRPT